MGSFRMKHPLLQLVVLGTVIGACQAPDSSMEAETPGEPEEVAAAEDEVAASAARLEYLETLEARWAERVALPQETRIVGGVPAEPGEFPWATALFYWNGLEWRQYCGATLIDTRWLLTAAHCQVDPNDRVIIGRDNLTSDDGEEHEIAAVINHELYEPDTHDFDIALIELATDSGQMPAPLSLNPATTEAGEETTVIGWGHTEEGGAASEVLRKVDVAFIDQTMCADNYLNCAPLCSAPAIVTENMICAAEEGQDSCQGDSGGGLLVFDTDDEGETFSYRVAGVVSWGFGCAREQFPGVYTDVAEFLGWIEETRAGM